MISPFSGLRVVDFSRVLAGPYRQACRLPLETILQRRVRVEGLSASGQGPACGRRRETSVQLPPGREDVMESSFEQAIAEHLELKRCNSALEQLPLERYLDGGAPAFADVVDQPAGRGDLTASAAEPVSWWDAANTTWESVSGFNWCD